MNPWCVLGVFVCATQKHIKNRRVTHSHDIPPLRLHAYTQYMRASHGTDTPE